MSTRERSAGVVVFRTGSHGPEFLLLDYGRYWDFAKGHVEAGESDRDAAVRETLEETGLAVRLTPGFSHEITYYFRHKSRGLIHKTVIFFVGEPEPGLFSAGVEVRLSDEHVGFEWLGYQAALQRLRFASAKQILQLAREFLNVNAQSGLGDPPTLR